MKRLIYKQLIDWKMSPERKPLVVYGARQVGKTYILKRFGEAEFDDMLYVNCYKNAQMVTLFNGDADVKRLAIGLSAYANKKIVPGKTLVFLDEIQEIPSVISSLKYFCEDMPELHVVVAGSLLGVMNMVGQSFPVGKVNILRLRPMSFEEFLIASGEEMLVELMQRNDWQMIDVFSPKLTDYLRQYYYVGGMPEAVAHFINNRDLLRVRTIQKDILTAYEADIAKHTGAETQRVRMVWNSVPAQLARENKKFIYGAIKKGARAKDYELAIQWLVDAGLLYKVERVRDPKLPLKFYADSNAFKLYMLDIGLLGAMVDTSAAQVIIGDSVFTEYKGAFTENYVLQQIKSLSDMPIYYYSKDNSQQEVDFILQLPDRVLPIEVKAETNVKSKSLSTFVNCDFKAYSLRAARFSMKPFQNQGWMENVPLYSVAGYIRSL